MASSSSSSQVKYDVFLSFRGEDTRDNFTSHLKDALCGRKIVTFIDDQLVRGDEISPSLLNAISGSKISIIIFSKGYASSTWCLQELVEILNCRRMYGQIVIPVFYHVDPSDVRKQTGTYGDAFDQYEVKYMEEKEMLQRWRNALTEAANLSGVVSNSIRPESELVDTITECILEGLDDKSYSHNKNLVGVAVKIRKIKSLLSDQSSKVCKLGLWGMGGIGKTTLAEAVFNEISSQFEASYFARNVREASNINQLRRLQKEFLYAILGDRHLDIRNTSTKKRLGRKRVLTVFDDVADSKQIKELIEDLEDLGFGSQIIITTRDKQVLTICGLDDSTIYKVEGLGSKESLRLFKQHAFKQNHRIDAVCLMLSEKVISYTEGLPLALEVLGSHLLGRGKLEWYSALEDLQKSPDEVIQKVLKMSYDELSDEEKTLFLNIACFFKGWDKYQVGKFTSHNRIRVLVDKALISILFTTIEMHDLIQEMGREIVRQESITKLGQQVYHIIGTDKIRGMLFNMAEMRKIHLNPHTFSEMANLRLLIVKNLYWRCNNEVHGFDSIEFDFSELECLCWDDYPFPSLPLKFDPDNLVVLKMQNNNLKQPWTGIKNLARLKYIDLSCSKHLLEVCCVPVQAKLSTAPASMSLGRIKGIRGTCNIHGLSRQHSFCILYTQSIKQTQSIQPDFKSSLVKIVAPDYSSNSSSIAGMRNLSGMHEAFHEPVSQFQSSGDEDTDTLNPWTLRSVGDRAAIFDDNLEGCWGAWKLQFVDQLLRNEAVGRAGVHQNDDRGKVNLAQKFQCFRGTDTSNRVTGKLHFFTVSELELAGVFRKFQWVLFIFITEHQTELFERALMVRTELACTLEAQALRYASLNFRLREAWGKGNGLGLVYLGGAESGVVEEAIRPVWLGLPLLDPGPIPARARPGLFLLYLSPAASRPAVKAPRTHSAGADGSIATSCLKRALYSATVPASIKVSDLSKASNLERLILSNCKSLVNLPIGIQSRSLRDVFLTGCSNLNTAPRISRNMERLCLSGTAIKTLSSSIESPSRLVELDLTNCLNPESLPSSLCNLTSLQQLDLSGLSNLKMVPEFPPEILELYLNGIAVKELSLSIGKVSSLIKLSHRNCSSLESLSSSLCNLTSLRKLDLSGLSNLKMVLEFPPEILKLYLDGTAVKELSSSIGKVSSLIRLSLRNCSSLESLPSSLCNLTSLRKLDLSGSSNLKMVPEFPPKILGLYLNGTAVKELSSSIGKVSSLIKLNLRNCSSLESFPSSLYGSRVPT
ncbi:disease resistance protein RRS1B-like [Mangifera indica]|uniref:disease resistance protein RRS1B-like n=1 Tax=Mangifera indica TaxID=29780 RepID=UPI001CFB1843|nr:disease resistance protein RRS1B-like [Mangifera indica]